MKQQFLSRDRSCARPVIGALLLAGLALAAGCGTGRPPAVEPETQQIEEAESAPSENPATAAAEDIPPPENDEGAAGEPVAMMKFEEANGFQIYQRCCAICHGADGDGAGFNAFNLDPKPRSHIDELARERVTDEEMTRSIALGGSGRGKSPLMPPWGRTLSSRQIRYVIAYIRLLQRQAQAFEAASGNQ